MEVLRYDSWHDPLTGLFDRRSFDRLLEMSVARSLRYHWPFTLVVIDLDGLKQINDGQGHAAGDAALQALASASAGSCASVTTRLGSAATSSR